MIDSNLDFIEDVRYFCNKARKKIQAVARFFLYMPLTQRKHLMNACILFQFGYFPLACMKQSKILSCSIKELHETHSHLD